MTAQNCDIKPLSTDTGKCYHCCSSDLCNNAGCGEQGKLSTDTGKCFHCLFYLCNNAGYGEQGKLLTDTGVILAVIPISVITPDVENEVNYQPTQGSVIIAVLLICVIIMPDVEKKVNYDLQMTQGSVIIAVLLICVRLLSTDSGKCYHCCSADLCNNAGCGEQGKISTETDHLETNGSVCYQCNGKLQSEACHHVTFCDFDELCHSIQYPYPVVGKRSVEREQCCDDDLCNNYRLKSPQTQIQQTTTPKVYTTTTDIARKFKDCTELNRNTQNSSGVYQIYPMGKNEGVPAYCDLKTDGEGGR
ncbi:unnamed protein product [Mytilus edulis]|uniref:Fibrinogen C-terminal domain-containing protein n=1 Tax=Mytilus edulis TaxID=6550 RepID=A0A8S3TXP1_MYTED|nr:unnamed protein product [Mytilus edulis]